jgi:hypothetical protein
MRRKGTPIGQYGSDLDFSVPPKGEELKAPRYASAAATRDYITTRNIIPNNTTTP